MDSVRTKSHERWAFFVHLLIIDPARMQMGWAVVVEHWLKLVIFGTVVAGDMVTWKGRGYKTSTCIRTTMENNVLGQRSISSSLLDRTQNATKGQPMMPGMYQGWGPLLELLDRTKRKKRGFRQHMLPGTNQWQGCVFWVFGVVSCWLSFHLV